MKELVLEIRERVFARNTDILTFLEEMVTQNSYSRNYEGINLVGDLVRRNMPVGLDNDVITDRNGVNHHLFSTRVQEEGKNLVLLGHVDTVFPAESDSRMFEESQGRSSVPGLPT